MKAFQRLKKMREDAGLRQKQIAEFLGVDQSFISKVESGERSLTVDQLEKLVNLYGYSFDSFVESNDNIQPIQFAFRAQEVSQEDLSAISAIGRIAINERFMAQLLEVNDA